MSPGHRISPSKGGGTWQVTAVVTDEQGHRNRSQRSAIIGLSDGATLRRPLDAAMQPVQPTRAGVLMTDRLADLPPAISQKVARRTFRPAPPRPGSAPATAAPLT